MQNKNMENTQKKAKTSASKNTKRCIKIAKNKKKGKYNATE